MLVKKGTTAFKVATVAAVTALMCWFPSASKEPGNLRTNGIVAILSFALGAAAASNKKSAVGATESTAVEVDSSIVEAARDGAHWMTAEVNRWHEVKICLRVGWR